MTPQDILTVIEPADSTIVGKVSQLTESLGAMSSEELTSMIVSGVMSVGSKILLALVFYFVCRFITKQIVKAIDKVMDKRGVEISLLKFITSLVSISLNLIIILTTISILGINTTSFLAIFASAGLAVGMALSGTLQNFAGGVLILFLKPFQVGDFIEAQGFVGTVKEISLFSTMLNTLDNKLIIIPNGPLSTSPINNYAKESTRCVEWNFNVAYGSDIDHVKATINSLLTAHPLVLQEKGLVIVLSGLNDSALNITTKAWCKSPDFLALLFDINEQVYRTFNQQGIKFPFPQLEVHMGENK